MGPEFFQVKKRRIVVYALVVLVCCALVTAWRYGVQHEQIEHEMHETTQVLATETSAIWTFMERNQGQFLRNEDGTYNLYCVVAAKAVAKIFTDRSDDFIIHYTNVTTRKKDDAPDEFEQEALGALLDDPSLKAYYDLTEDAEGNPVFRYVEPLYYEESCLDCHGDPAGELDVMGYAKEGKQKGDLAGAASIIMPADTYLANMRSNILWETVVFLAIAGASVAVIAWLATRVNAARIHALEQDNRMKSDFLAMISHEVRTPLTSILAFSDIWAAQNEPRDAEERKIMGEMRANSQVLLGIVNNMLEMARIEAGKMRVLAEPVDVVDLVNLVKAQMGFLADKKGVSLHVQVEQDVPIVLADSEKVRRICENLVSNAIKFTEAGGSVVIAASYDEEAAVLAVRVSDTGMGIAEDDLPRIFDKFTQSSAASGASGVAPGRSAASGGASDGAASGAFGGAVPGRSGNAAPAAPGGAGGEARASGSGLGLALVKELAELHGGSVEVGSRLGQGSTFTVRLAAPAVGEDGIDAGGVGAGGAGAGLQASG